MRSFVRTFLFCAGWMGLTSALYAAPANITVAIHGEFDAGTSGATATNSPTTSTLTLRTATVSYDSSTVTLLMKPGDVQTVPLGNLFTATGGLDPLSFDGATLDLVVELVSPEGVPAFDVLTADITGSVGVSGETLNFAWRDPTALTFVAGDCVPKALTLTVEPSTSVVSGSPGVDIGGELRVAYLSPVVPGDVDGDGSVTFHDAVRAMSIISGLDQGQCEETERGDAVDDGVLDMLDVVTIIRTSYAGM